jgi:hypothetical protein
MGKSKKTASNRRLHYWDPREPIAPKVQMETISAVQSNTFSVSTTTVLVSLSVGVVLVVILIMLLCCYIFFRRNTQRGGAQHSFLDTPYNHDPYYRGSRRSLEAQLPQYEFAVRRQETHQMPHVQQMLRGSQDVQNLEAVNSVIEAMRAAHAPPKVSLSV